MTLKLQRDSWRARGTAGALDGYWDSKVSQAAIFIVVSSTEQVANDDDDEIMTYWDIASVLRVKLHALNTEFIAHLRPYSRIAK